MLFNWLPWKWLVRYLARQHDLLDPFALLGQFKRFAQESEVSVPMELLRAGLQFQARGLMNTRAIQMNLDWVWPFWVQRQYDPADPAFVPRAFSATHINLSHRNWTAIGLPGCRAFPLLDPRGLLTPFFDGWSIDAWVVTATGQELLPAREAAVAQTRLDRDDTLGVLTKSARDGLALCAQAHVEAVDGEPVCHLECRAHAPDAAEAWLALVLRPFNPEGVSFIHEIAYDAARARWSINGAPRVQVLTPPARHVASTYPAGDVHRGLLDRAATDRIACDVGMASAALLYPIAPDETREASLRIPLAGDAESQPLVPGGPMRRWDTALAGTSEFQAPDKLFVSLYHAAIRTLVLLSPEESYPGPYTYKRFWFRDAAFMLHALLAIGATEVVDRALQRFPDRLTRQGFFRSQDGEWDSNGQVLWLLQRTAALTGTPLADAWQTPVQKAAAWIRQKRLSDDGRALHGGLLPAGFSAEHLGNNDFYYWDDYWGVAGLRAAGALVRAWGDAPQADAYVQEAEDLMEAIQTSLRRSQARRSHAGIPASPYRQLDAGAVGSLVAAYPLGLLPPEDESLAQTTGYLLEHCFRQNAFFQDLIHSGYNAYLSLHVAQALLRAGDPRFWPIVRRVAALASPTGQWPEAIHPRTGGGCMGDGQHGWAAAEWVMMVRSLFLREEGDRLLLAPGIPAAWLQSGQPLHFGPTLTPWGPVTVTLRPDNDLVCVSWQAEWRGPAPVLEVHLGDEPPRRIEGAEEESYCLVWNPNSSKHTPGSTPS